MVVRLLTENPFLPYFSEEFLVKNLEKNVYIINIKHQKYFLNKHIIINLRGIFK